MCPTRARLVHSCAGSWWGGGEGGQLGGAEVAGVPAASPPRIAGMFLQGCPVPSPWCEPLRDAFPKTRPVPLLLAAGFQLGALLGEPW